MISDGQGDQPYGDTHYRAPARVRAYAQRLAAARAARASIRAYILDMLRIRPRVRRARSSRARSGQASKGRRSRLPGRRALGVRAKPYNLPVIRTHRSEYRATRRAGDGGTSTGTAVYYTLQRVHKVHHIDDTRSASERRRSCATRAAARSDPRPLPAPAIEAGSSSPVWGQQAASEFDHQGCGSECAAAPCGRRRCSP
eukprot:COSAG02_NODE_164_length_32230_cov_37.505587_13_plen_199_part_00